MRHSPLSALWLRVCLAVGWTILASTSARASANPARVRSFPGSISQAGWPLFFEANPSPADGPANFLARGPNYQLLVAPTEVDFALRQAPPRTTSVRREQSLPAGNASIRALRMVFASANREAAIFGAGELDGKLTYLIGNDPARWRSQVPIFSRVQVQGLYAGIDLVYYGNQRQFEYDFTIAPGVDPGAIAFRFEGLDKLTISPAGELVIGLGDAELRQHRPLIYQMVHGERHEISGGYRLQDARTVGFTVGKYDPDWPLVIDPVFSYATYFGGNAGDTGLAIKVDNNGSVYLAGETLSTKFPAALAGNPAQPQFHGGVTTGDAFVAKLDSTGSKLLYFTYLGGSSDDGAYDLAIDAVGNAYITGFTVSADFPTRNALFPQISGSPDPTFHVYPVEAFVAELNTNGSALVYSTFLGGSDKDLGSAIALDPAGNAYVTGYTYSTNFPVLNPVQAYLSGNDDVFVAKLAPGGRNLVYSTYLGGRSIDEGEGIAADADGYAYVVGYTASTNFPVSLGAFQNSLNGSGVAVTVYDAFVSKIAPNGLKLAYSTYLGGAENDYGYRVALDSSQNAYVTGTTQSSDFPHTNAFNLGIGQNGTNLVNFDAFLTKIGTNGSPVYSAQFGGTDNDAGWGVAVDPSGRAFVIGITLSTNFPVTNPFDLFRATNSGGQDIFVAAFDTNPAPALYCAYLGGGGKDFGYAIAVDAEANAYLSGMTFSAGFTTTSGAFSRALNGPSDAFAAKIRLFDPMLNVEQVSGGFEITWPATAPDYVLQSTLDLSPPQSWSTVPEVPILTNGQYMVSVTSTNSSTLFRLLSANKVVVTH